MHTDLHPDGEIRGRSVWKQIWCYAALMNGFSEVPSVASDGKGLFVANLREP
jgi:hypothetical protein